MSNNTGSPPQSSMTRAQNPRKWPPGAWNDTIMTIRRFARSISRPTESVKKSGLKLADKQETKAEFGNRPGFVHIYYISNNRMSKE